MSEVKTAAQQWQRVKTILADALELESPKERTAFLEGSCDGDTTLMREVEALLAQSTQNLDELAEDTPLAFARHAPAQPSGRRIGAYEIVREIGRGGMGAVYLAKRADGQFEKEVAIKLLKRGTDTDEILRRFHAERRILARLDHPNIARLLDAGTTDDGLPYFVMEYIDGVPITSYARETRLSVAQRLQLFLKVCEAVQFAHQHRVVHRDLKPGNIFVRQDGEPKLLDFGIAKFLAAGDEGIDQTLTAERRFTPICASPEQARGETVTPASDVYALGALLYELMTDRPPHRFSTPHPSPAEVAQVIGEQEPIRPSLSIYDNKVRRQLRGDLDRIVLMALRKEPARRYSSVAEFAEDIRRHIQGRAIHARSNTLAYVSGRFVVLHKYRIATLLTLTGLGITLGVVLLSYRAELNRRASFAASQPPQTMVDKSIAVLPFENLSDDKGNSFFADGVQDEILTDLAKVRDLKVISRTSVMQYKNFATRNLREIAQQLGVVHVLEGSVQRAGNRVRVSAQLIDARSDAHLWAEHYERDASDVFAIQNEIAKNIVEQLQAKISPSERKALEEKPTSDLVAYDLYLRAIALWHGISISTDWEGDNRRAVELLDRAVTQDANFALAYCFLTELNLNLYGWVDRTPARLAKAEAALQRANQIAPELGQTYLQRANVYGAHGDWARAAEMLTLAAKALPGSADVLVTAAEVEQRLGRWNEAVRDMEKAKELDPRGPNIPNTLDGLYAALREYAKSDEVADAAIAAFPKGPNYFYITKVYTALRRGDMNAAKLTLAAIPPGFDPSGAVSLVRIKLAVTTRNYTEALHLVGTIRKENLIELIAIDIAFLQFLAAEKSGDTGEAKTVLLAVRTKAEAELRERPDESTVISRLAQIDAYLGRNEDALRESARAVELKPISLDAVDGPDHAVIRAEVLMRAGDRNSAIELLSQLATIPYGLHRGDLLGPRWDALRDDPRFAKIVEESARPIDPKATGDKRASEPAPDKSIAVLPFENLSDDKANAFFADGMQDEILTDLAKVQDLRVISRTSVMQYKDVTTRNLRDIALQLRVAHVLEGSVQRVANRIRVSAQLIDARTDAHLWAEHYDRDASDVFGIQNEIAKSIVEQLQAKISPNERKALEEKPTTDLVAYDLYLRGKALMDEIATSTDWEGDNRRAIDLLDRAVTHDPKFAAAYAQLCDFHLNLYDWVEHTPQRLAQADDAVQKATRLAPSSAATYLAQADFAACQRKWSQSLEFLQRAQQLQPGNSTFLIGIALAEDHLGQSREAVRDLEKARELAPRDPNIPNALDWMYTGFRDYRKSDEVADAAIVNFPNGPNYYRAQKVLNALHRGDWKEASRRLALIPEKFDPSGFRSLLRLEIPFGERDSAEFARILASVPRNNFIGIMERDVVFMEALLAEKQGDRAKMESVLNTFRTKLEAELRAEGPDKGPSYHPLQIANLALVHCYLGQMEDALRESQQAIDLAPKAVDVMKWAPDAFVRAEILMRAGQTDRALDLLEEVAKVPYGPSYGELLGLQWDRLRGDPRFAKLLEEAAQPIDLTRTEDKKDTEPAAPDKSIAVLPFENLSKDKGNDVFAAGIQDELITDLAQIADLKVISRASVTQYTDAAARNVRAIAAELRVAHLLTGTVQRAGDRIRVSAQLLNGRTEAHEWAQQYERDVADVFAIQAELAQSIAAQLQARISPNEMNAMAQQPTSDLVAYDLYLRGKALWDEISTSTDWEGDNRRAIELLERATTHDPNFAIAYGVLCELHLNLYEWVEHSPARLAQANAPLQQAIRLAPATAETLLAQAEYLGAEKDWKRSLELLQRALQLQPGNAKLFNRIALAKERLGLAQEALRDMEKARELAPRDPNIPNHLMQMYTRVRDYKKSDEVAEAALASFPNAPSYFRAREVVNSLGRGDLKQARERLALVPVKFDASGFKSLLRLEIPFFERNYEEFDRVAASIPRGNLIRSVETDVILFEALVAEKRGDTAKKESILNALCATLEAEVRERGVGEAATNSPTQLAELARVHCYLGRMDDALRESEEAVKRTSIVVDALNGPANLSIQAEVLMRTGQTDRATELLEQLAKHPYGLSYGELLSLRWDRLRGDARFTQIVGQLQKRL